MAQDNIIFYLTIVVFISFLLYIQYKKSIEAYILFVLYCIPLTSLLATKVGWGGFRIFDIISFFCLGFFLKRFFLSQVRRNNRLNNLLLIALIIIIFFGCLISESPIVSILSLVQILPAFIYFRFILIACKKNRLFYLKVINAIKFNYVLLLVFIAIQLIVGLKFTFYPTLNPNTSDAINNVIRYPGFFHDSQANGQFLAMGSFFFLYNSNNLKKNKLLLNYIFFLCCACGIFLSGSRSALSGFFIGVLILIIFGGYRSKMYVLMFALTTLIIYTAVKPKFLVIKRTESLDEDYKFRQSIWKEAFNISLENPVLGIGIGNFKSYTEHHNRDLYLETEDEITYFDQPENGYLKILSEIGFIGFALFFVLLIKPIIRSLFLYIKGIYEYKIIFLNAAIVSWLVAFTTVYSLFDSRITILVTTLLALVVIHPVKHKNHNEQAIQS